MNAARCLCEEHDLILKVLGRLEAAIEQARHDGLADHKTFEPFVEFFSGFTAGAHFCKEEHGLFPLLQTRGIPHEGSPLAALEHEHELVRDLVRDFTTHLETADDGLDSAMDDVLDTGSRLANMLREHIARADHCILGMASNLLRDAEPKEVEQAYSAAEQRAGDEATLQRWRALAEELAGGRKD